MSQLHERPFLSIPRHHLSKVIAVRTSILLLLRWTKRHYRNSTNIAVNTPGDPEGVAAFFVALSRAKQRAIFAFCQQRGQRNNVAELYQLLTAAGVPEIAI